MGAEMSARLRELVSLAILLAVSSFAPVPVAGQDSSAASNTPTAKPWTQLRTPWGDPDLQAVWSYNDDVDTPFERPAELAGKQTVEDEEEQAALLKARARRNVERAPTIGGETGAGPVHWYEFWAAKSARTSRVVDPPDGRVPPLTPEAQILESARAEARRHRGPADSWEDRSLWDRCIAARGGLPHVIVNPGSYNNIVQILQSPGYVVILHEMIHQARIISLDGRPHVGSNVRQYLGDARGRWEGDTLVVDVTNFTDKTDFRGSRETLHLVERWTRVNADTLNYAVTVDDPTTFTKPWTVGVPMRTEAGQTQIFEYACHEGNYGLANILSAARAEEKASGKAK
jgi:hypothetical protein